MPLARGQALGECAGAANKERLLSLLVPVQRASETCPWLKDMVAAGEIPTSASAADHASVCAERPRLTATVAAKAPSAAIHLHPVGGVCTDAGKRSIRHNAMDEVS
jgi:hypothetical protein